MAQRPAIGFDLDLTLVDTRAATASSLRHVNATLGVDIDADAFVAELGIAMRDHLARWVPDELLDEAGDVFRAHFTTEAQPLLRPAPGAVSLLAALRRNGSPIVVVTSRRDAVAATCLATVGLPYDALTGGVTGPGKVPVIRAAALDAYVGDHVLDVRAAREAGVLAVGVATGNHSPEALAEAGADVVTDTLEPLADLAWLPPAGSGRPG